MERKYIGQRVAGVQECDGLVLSVGINKKNTFHVVEVQPLGLNKATLFLAMSGDNKYEGSVPEVGTFVPLRLSLQPAGNVEGDPVYKLRVYLDERAYNESPTKPLQSAKKAAF